MKTQFHIISDGAVCSSCWKCFWTSFQLTVKSKKVTPAWKHNKRLTYEIKNSRETQTCNTKLLFAREVSCPQRFIQRQANRRDKIVKLNRFIQAQQSNIEASWISIVVGMANYIRNLVINDRRSANFLMNNEIIAIWIDLQVPITNSNVYKFPRLIDLFDAMRSWKKFR